MPVIYAILVCSVLYEDGQKTCILSNDLRDNCTWLLDGFNRFMGHLELSEEQLKHHYQTFTKVTLTKV